MEKNISVEERIKRAEERYYNTLNRDYNNIKNEDNIQSNKKNITERTNKKRTRISLDSIEKNFLN